MGQKKKKDNKDRNPEKQKVPEIMDESKIQEEKLRDEQIEQDGRTVLDKGSRHHRIQLISIIGEIEGHDVLSGNTKATKFAEVFFYEKYCSLFWWCVR